MSPKDYNAIHASRKHKSQTRALFARPNKLEAFRLCVFLLVFLSSLIALAVSAHFLTVLQPNDLTHFIPFALFTSVASIIAMIALTSIVLIHKSKPAALKFELGIMATIGVLWLILSIFVSTSPAESADVQCFADDGDLLGEDDGPFDSEVFHAQYRVLTAMGSVNAFILLILCAAIAFLALRHFNRTRDWVSTTRKPLLGEKKSSKTRAKSRSVPALTDLPRRVARKSTTPAKDKEKPSRSLPLPAVAQGASRSNNVNRNGTAGSRPLQPTPQPTPRRPPIVKSSSAPLPAKPRPSPPKDPNSLTPPPKAKVVPAAGGTTGGPAKRVVPRRSTQPK